MSGETTVGSIVGFLRLDASQWNEELDKAEAKAEALGRHDPKIKVEVNSAEIIAKLDAVSAAVSAMDKNQTRLTLNGNQSLKNLERAYASTGTTAKQGMDRVAESTRKVTSETEKLDKSSQSAKQSGSALVTAIIALGPALVPIAAGAAGLAVGFGGMGAAGVLAMVGIKDQMAKGTAVGLTFKSTLDGAKASLMGLAATAATNVLGPLQQAVAAMDSRLPSLNSEFGLLATATGKVGASVVNGLLSAFVQLSPLMNTVATYAVNLAARFDAMMSGPGVKSFGDYAMSVFPQVMATLESLVGAAVRLVAAFAPLGGGVLSEVKLLADVLNAIDPSTLTVLATAVGSVAIGFKAWQGLSGLVSGLGGALEKVGFSAETAATGVRTLEIATGIIGIAIAGLSVVMSVMSSNTQAAQQATDNLAQALINSNGAIDDNVRLSALKNAQDAGAIDNARLLGIGTQQVVDAYLGQTGAIGDLNKARDAALTKQQALVDSGQADASTMTDVETAYLNLKNELAAAGIQWDDSKVKVQQHTDALKAGKTATSAQADAMAALAGQYSTTPAIIGAVTDAQKKTAAQAQTATVQMQLENNAAGLLKQSLDALSGKSLSAAQAQNSFDSALANMGDHVTATGSKIHFTTKSIGDMSSASVSLRGQLLGQVTAAEQTSEAYGQMKGSAEEGRKKLIDLRQQIIDNAAAHGVDRDAVTKYIDSVLSIPKSVPPTKLDVDKAAAEAKAKEFIGVINGVPTWRDTVLHTDKAVAQKQAQEFLGVINGIPTWRSTTLSVNVVSNVNAAVASISSSIASIGASVAHRATGGPIPGRANGGPVPGFAGGTLIGPGTGTSDSIMAMVAETGNLLRVSAGEFVSTDASRRRNLGALEAGNRGAVLQVAGQGGNGSGRVVNQTFNVQPTDPYAIARESARYYDMVGV